MDLHGVSLNSLNVLKLIIDLDSVSKTAEALGKTQSTISSTLKQLREKLNDELVEYVNGCYHATKKGLELYQDIDRLLSRINSICCDLNSKTYRILVSDAFAILHLPELLEFCQENNIKIIVDIYPIYEIANVLQDTKKGYHYELCIGSNEPINGRKNTALFEGDPIVITNKASQFTSLDISAYMNASHITLSKHEPEFIAQTVGTQKRQRAIVSSNLLLSLELISKVSGLLLTTAKSVYEKYQHIYPIKSVPTNFKFEKKLNFYSCNNTTAGYEALQFFENWWQQQSNSLDIEVNL